MKDEGGFHLGRGHWKCGGEERFWKFNHLGTDIKGNGEKRNLGVRNDFYVIQWISTGYLILHMVMYMFQWSSNPSLCVNPRGTGWGGRREGGSEGGAYIYLWLIHADIWQKPTQYCYTNKAIILQSKIKWAIPNTRTHTQRMTCRFLTEWLCTWHVIDWELGEGPYLEVEMLTFPMNMASLRCLWIPQVENSPHIISCPGLKGAV